MALYTLRSGSQAVTSGLLPLNNGVSLTCSELIVQNSLTSAATIFVGAVDNASYELLPGMEVRMLADLSTDEANIDIARTYVRLSSGTATVNWLARQ